MRAGPTRAGPFPSAKATIMTLRPALPFALFALLAGSVAVLADEALLPATRTDLSADDLKRVQAVTAPTTDFSKAEAFEAMSGGAGTSIATINTNIFSHGSENLPLDGEERFKLGNALFRKLWVSAPSSTQASDGLGPLFNARSCQECHIKDGRGHPPGADGNATSMFLRLARPAKTLEEQKQIDRHALANFPDAVYGTQLQDRAVPGLAAEGG